MTRHLNEHELASATAGIPLEAEQQAHLEGCISCRQSINHFLEILNERRHSINDGAPDWDHHANEILTGISSAPEKSIFVRRRWRSPLLAAAATLIITFGAGVLFRMTGPATAPPSRPEIQIEEILAQAESLLADEGIPGLDVFEDVTDDDLAALLEAQSS